MRSTSFLIADGVLPSNEGRGYVLRRIMRRAMRHAHMMGARDPVMYRLVPALVRQMGLAYPELGRAETLIEETLQLEETRFKAMLERGLGLLTEETARLGERRKAARQRRLPALRHVRLPARPHRGCAARAGPAGRCRGVRGRHGRAARAAPAPPGRVPARRRPTASGSRSRIALGASEFLGYTEETAEGEIRALIVGGQPVDSALAGAEVAVVLNQTPFYGESGGQVGDTGTITGADGLRIVVTDTQKKLSDVFVHLGRVEAGEARVGAAVVAEVDHARRTAIRAHHSADAPAA